MTDSNIIPLGRPTSYPQQYDPSQLFAVPRAAKRAELRLGATLPFKGEDVWNGYEISWLNSKGKPVAALGRFRFPCTSPHIVESKSFKLYLNSFNQSKFDSSAAVRTLMEQDLSTTTGAAVQITLYPLGESAPVPTTWQITALEGICIDHLDIEINCYQTTPELLQQSTPNTDIKVTQTLYSHLLKSNCLITAQPDWASIWINYQGAEIDHVALLRYLISFRQHNEFHEQCVERIFTDLWHHCHLEHLSVYARYTRRGGLDINPWRSTETAAAPDWRLVRQ